VTTRHPYPSKIVVKKLLVLAKTAEQVRFFCQDYGIPVTNVLYIMDEQRVRGYQNPAYVVLEGFWERIDAMEIWMALQMAMTHPLPLPNKIQPAAQVMMPPKANGPVATNTIATSGTVASWSPTDVLAKAGLPPGPSSPVPEVETDEDGLPVLAKPAEPPPVHHKQFKKIRVPK
jgi:hypothetical protein